MNNDRISIIEINFSMHGLHENWGDVIKPS